LAELLDEDVVAERVGAARQTLVRMFGLAPGDVGERVVASITFLGLASRLLSPPLGAVVAGGALPRADLDRMWWRAVEGGPVPIASCGLVATAGLDAAAAARRLVEETVRGLVEPVLAVFRRRFALSDHVLWGNVASALGGAAGMIADTEASSATTDAAAPHSATARTADAGAGGSAERAAAIVQAMLRMAPLLGTATLERPDSQRARWFLVRRNCCLYYRLPGGGTCGDCVLTPEEVRRQQWQSVLSR
jgi:hypothetical protein